MKPEEVAKRIHQEESTNFRYLVLVARANPSASGFTKMQDYIDLILQQSDKIAKLSDKLEKELE